MKYSLTLSLFLGLLSKDAAALRLQQHHHHHKHQHLSQYDGDKQDWVDHCDAAQHSDPWAQKNPSGAGTYEQGAGGRMPGVGIECQGFAQKKSHSMAQYDGDKQDWVDKCDAAQNPWAQKNPSGAGTYKDEKTGGSFPGVGVECQGFAQKSSRSQYSGDSQAWVDDCQPGRDPLIQNNPNAGTGGSYPGVGVECQGFSKKQSRAQYSGDSQAWVDDCQPGRDPLIQNNPNAGTGGSYQGVGIECQGFSKKQSRAQYDGDSQAWVDDCDPGRNPLVQANGGAGTVTSYPGVGIECQGFAQKKSKHHKKHHKHHKSHKLVQYSGDTQAWVDPCDENSDPWAQKNPSGAGTYNGPKLHGSYPGVGVECYGFAQKKAQSRAQYSGDSQAWVDLCDPTQDTVAQKNPSGAGTPTYPGVGVECQGFAQKKAHSYVQYDGDKQDWVDHCDAAQHSDPWAQKNPSGAGTYETTNGGRLPGVGIECQGFAQIKDDEFQHSGTNTWVNKCDPDQDTVAQKNPSGAGTHEDTNKGSFPNVGVDCQGFAQKSNTSPRVRPETTFHKDCPGNLPDCNGTNGTPGTDCC